MALTINDITPTANAKGGSLKERLARYLLGELVGYDKSGNMLDPVQYYNPDTILAGANDSIANGMAPDVARKSAMSLINEGKRVAPFLGDADIDEASIGDWAKLTGTAVMKHPFKTAGLIGLGAGNLGGLTDNNKFGGQLGGLALGGLGAHFLSGGNPYAAAMLTLGGGQLGALFDKLRSKKEQQPQGYGRF